MLIGKAERGSVAASAIRRGCGAGYRLSQAIRLPRVIAFTGLGMASIHEF